MNSSKPAKCRFLFAAFGCFFITVSGGMAQVVVSNPVPSPVIDDSGFAGGTWFEDFYPYTEAAPITISSLIGEGVSQHQIESVVPLVEGSRGLLSGLVSYNYDSEDFSAGSIGLSFGFVFDDAVAARIRAHGDFADSPFSNRIDQFSPGFDIYTKWGIDLHGNFYFPGDEQYVTGQFSRLAGGGQTRRFEAPRAEGHQIRQDEFLDTAAIIQRDFEFREQAMDGRDFRVSFDVPVICELLNLSTRGTIGVYQYDGVFGQGDMTGMLAGVHMYPLRGVALGAEFYEDKALYGDNWLFSTSVTMALDDVFSPRAWGRSLRTAFSRRPACRQSSDSLYLRSRLLSPAVRKPRPTIAQSGPILTDTTQVAPATTELIQDKLIMDDVIFVNNGGAAGNGIQRGRQGGAGTAENPTNSINEGANLVQSQLGGEGTVYVQAGNTYNEDVVVDASGTNAGDGVTPVARAAHGAGTRITFTSSFKPIAACGGLNFGGDTGRARVNGGFYARDIAFAQIEGFHVTGGLGFNPPDAPTAGNQDGAGIVGANVVDLIVNCNVTDTQRNGIAAFVENADTNSILIFDNEVLGTQDNGSETDDTGILVRSQGTGTVGTAQVFDNMIQNTVRHGILVRTDNSSTISDGLVDNNVIEGAGDLPSSRTGHGIRIFANNNASTLNLSSVSGNQISAIPGTDNGDGIHIQTQARATMNLGAVNNNQIDGVDDVGIRVDARTNNTGAGSSLTIASIDGNRLTNIDVPGGDDGISVRLSNSTNGDGGSTLMIGSINNNLIDSTGGEGIDVLVLNEENPGGAGIFNQNLGTLTVGSIDGNTVLNTDNTAIRVFGGASSLTGAVERSAEGTLTITNGINNNFIRDFSTAPANLQSGDGIEILARENVAVVVGDISGNDIDMDGVANTRGIDVVTNEGIDSANPGYDATITTGLITGNTIANTGDRGINVEGQDDPNNQPTITVAGITSNTLTNIGDNNEEGIRLLVDDFDAEIVIGAAGIANNTLTNINGEGIALFARDNGSITVPTITANILAGATQEGFEADSDNASTISINTFSLNSLTGIGDTGEGVRLSSSGTSSLTIGAFDGNTIIGAAYTTGIRADEVGGASTLSITGTVSNTVTPGSNGPGNDEFNTDGTVVGGGITINGVATASNSDL